jgi:hypothetical protein
VSNVYLVTTGNGSDGDEWNVHGIFATQEAADTFVRGTSGHSFYEVEEWGVHGSTLSDSERDALATLDQLRIENAQLRLTDAEREAIQWFSQLSYGEGGRVPDYAATLRKLLERLK